MIAKVPPGKMARKLVHESKRNVAECRCSQIEMNGERRKNKFKPVSCFNNAVVQNEVGAGLRPGLRQGSARALHRAEPSTEYELQCGGRSERSNEFPTSGSFPSPESALNFH